MSIWEYRPQTIALIPDALIFLSSGMNLALGLGYSYYQVSNHFRFAWFIGVIAGVLLSAPLIQISIKRYFVLLSSFVVVVSGIVYTVCPHDEVALLAARYLNGIGTGLITVPFIMHCSEISIISRRGGHLGIEQFSIAIGIFIQATYTGFWSGGITISANRVHGICCLTFGLIALGLAYIVIESPVFFVRLVNDAQALDCLTRLQLPTVLTDEKKALLEEHKNYVMMNEYLGKNESFTRGLGPLARMILYRAAVAFTFSYFYNEQLMLGSVWGITSGNQWPWTIYAALRILGVFTAVTMLDLIGRKIPSLIGLLVMGGLGIGIAVLFAHRDNWQNGYQMSMACALLMIFQFFAGLYAPTSTLYLGEAFPMLLKPYFIALCISVECAVHIIVICTYHMNLHVFAYDTFTYAYLFACFLLFLFTIPDTKLTTLNEAQERFRAWNHWRSW
ncbi:high-affinity glucose transporter ght2-like [Rhagoletis pomonella]|uniref:high-affinity glucose transporter ght2-like n=1 Tax=Rhagoletis pomonella TaxID=28610 RepID=UPI0017826FE4|nr:high-affinity glucose transporter ght2-like [Rhagoletis pomonella]